MALATDLIFSVVAEDAFALGDSAVTSRLGVFSEKSGCGIGDVLSTFFAADGAGVSYAPAGDE
jgi:hypothetical protein